jgi:hypothetical protein
MRGSNELHLNQLTINEALEEYLNKHTVGLRLKVTNVKEQTKSNCPVFVVSVEEVKGLQDQ